MEHALNIRQLATKIKDISTLGFDAGVYFNSVGNFSLARLPNGNFLCQLRRFGYFISTVRQSYLTNPNLKLSDPDGHLLLELDGDFNFIRKFNLTRNDYYKHEVFFDETPFLEDGRLVEWDGKYYLTSAIFYQHNEHYQKFGLEVQEISIDGDSAQATHVWNSVEHGIMGRQKNWMPVPDRPFNFVIGTSSHGTRVVDISTDQIWDVGSFDEDDLYRGNSPLVKVAGGYLTITHKLTEDLEGRKRYNNYFILLDDALEIVAVSKAFKMCDKNIEFATHLSLDGSKVVVGNTIMDDTPEIMEFDKNQLVDLLELPYFESVSK